jgi:hypothetical protein
MRHDLPEQKRIDPVGLGAPCSRFVVACSTSMAMRGINLTHSTISDLLIALGTSSDGDRFAMLRLAVSASLLLSSITVWSAPGLAHGGGLNAQGCHNNRKTGDYHCHRGSNSRATSSGSQKRHAVLSAGGAYANCSAARAAGAAPVRRGDPGYGSHLDRDDDGVGCE